jgi:hypothetical protein
VDGARRAKENPFALREIRATEQAAHPSHGVVCDVAALARDAVVDSNGDLTVTHL